VIAEWAIKFHLIRRQNQALFHSLFNLAISVGAIQAIIERVAKAREVPVADLQAAIQGAAIVNADETGHAHQGGGAKKKRHWLWVAATALPRIAASRGLPRSSARTSRSSSAATAGGPRRARAATTASCAGPT